MGIYRDRVLPRVLDVALGARALGTLRARTAAGLSGDVLELGFGTGRNVDHYPWQVRRVLAVDPAVAGRRIAAPRVARSPVAVEYVGLDGQELPLDDASVDNALSTWTLCTIPDVARALGEVRRVLRPGGRLHFLEHGLSPDARVARWQHRLTPLQARLAGGCHLDRPIDTLVADAGFRVGDVRHYYVAGPKAFGYMSEGVAVS